MSLERRVERLEAQNGTTVFIVVESAEEAKKLREMHPEPGTVVIITGIPRTPNERTKQ
ncbi:hypothetical protein [Syntrophobacter fumaroxidans]|uniref:hypothetical protein n=1 Tax=Syntrophobacter fumaroxidans TaxID=119484 RepID=UPI000324404B|nr:hypothetical protein [Syntrophobacter fumaroxidans]